MTSLGEFKIQRSVIILKEKEVFKEKRGKKIIFFFLYQLLIYGRKKESYVLFRG
jgi:hypothetical protein